MFDCDACPVAAALETLAPENAEAWRLFQRLVARFVVDAGVGAEAFRRLTEEYGADEFADLLERLTIIYDVVMPERKPSA